MSEYIRLPTKKRQFFTIAVSLIGYVVIIWLGDIFLPEISESGKKKFSQAGLVFIYVASLTAGLSFVWNAKAQKNIEIADKKIEQCRMAMGLLEDQSTILGYEKFKVQISDLKAEITEANKQKDAAKQLPKFYDWAGVLSMVLLALGTLFCFIGVT